AGVELTGRRLTFAAPGRVREAARTAGVPPSLHAFSHSCNGFELHWQAPGHPDPDVAGGVRILSLAQILQDWEGVVYFAGDPADSVWRSFRPVDFFTDERCVGIFTGEHADDSLHLYTFSDDDTVRLDLDLFGYADLLCAARGFLHWPSALELVRTGRDSVEAERFRSAMPQLFPGFSWPGFVEAYQALRLSAR
ncbi:MAG TPA: hypothetical protein VD813_00050, partial [Pseudonocardia sp.]|nr:hypothetical protein [Pseudonocardia sp.]